MTSYVTWDDVEYYECPDHGAYDPDGGDCPRCHWKENAPRCTHCNEQPEYEEDARWDTPPGWAHDEEAGEYYCPDCKGEMPSE